MNYNKQNMIFAFLIFFVILGSILLFLHLTKVNSNINKGEKLSSQQLGNNWIVTSGYNYPDYTIDGNSEIILDNIEQCQQRCDTYNNTVDKKSQCIGALFEKNTTGLGGKCSLKSDLIQSNGNDNFILSTRDNLWYQNVGKDYPGQDIQKLGVTNIIECQQQCDNNDDCIGAIYRKDHGNMICWIKSNIGPSVNLDGSVLITKPHV